MIIKQSILAALLFCTGIVAAQTSDETADRMLLYQRNSGGWPKAVGSVKVDYGKPVAETDAARLRETRDAKDGTIDNNATTREIAHLIRAYARTGRQTYLDAAQHGLVYLFSAQYPNGGWPQFFPDRRGYRAQITFNDNAIANVLNLMLDVSAATGDYAAVGKAYRLRASAALALGVECVLKTQYVYRGQRTVWAAQYDENTLLPAQARSFELPSLASAESAGILRFLMRLPDPSPEVCRAVESGLAWFDATALTDVATERIDAPAEVTGSDVVLRTKPGSLLWARFYDLQEMKPMFAGRNGVMRRKLEEIENERRTGYTWYGNWGTPLRAGYREWQQTRAVSGKTLRQ